MPQPEVMQGWTVARYAFEDEGLELARRHRGSATGYCWLVIEGGEVVAGPFLSRVEAEQAQADTA